MTNTHWSERARLGLRGAAEFVETYGSQIGMASAGILGTMGAACTAMAIGASDPETTTLYREGAAAFVLAAALKAGGWAAAEQIARTHLRGVDHLFDDPQWREATTADVRGAEAIDIDDPTQTPEFRQAVRQLYNDLANDPENRAEAISILRRSPNARRALVEGGDLDGMASATKAQAESVSGNMADDSPSPSPGAA